MRCPYCRFGQRFMLFEDAALFCPSCGETYRPFEDEEDDATFRSLNPGVILPRMVAFDAQETKEDRG